MIVNISLQQEHAAIASHDVCDSLLVNLIILAILFKLIIITVISRRLKCKKIEIRKRPKINLDIQDRLNNQVIDFPFILVGYQPVIAKNL